MEDAGDLLGLGPGFDASHLFKEREDWGKRVTAFLMQASVCPSTEMR